MAEDSWIVEGLRSADVRAWDELYRRHAPTVWRDVAFRLGFDSADVADVVQEVFLDAARSAHTYRESSGTISQWLQGITHHKVALYWRKQMRSRRNAIEDANQLFDWLDGSVNDPPSILESEELVQAVRETLHRMTPKNADLLIQKYVHGKSVREIAEEYNTGRSATEAQLKRARQQFRAKFVGESQPKRHATEKKS